MISKFPRVYAWKFIELSKKTTPGCARGGFLSRLIFRKIKARIAGIMRMKNKTTTVLKPYSSMLKM